MEPARAEPAQRSSSYRASMPRGWGLVWLGAWVFAGLARPAALAAAPEAIGLPAHVRLALMVGGDLEQAAADCRRGVFPAPTPDRWQHEPPHGPHWVDLGFQVPGELPDPWREAVSGLGQGGRCGLVQGPYGPALILLMSSLPPFEYFEEERLEAARRGREASELAATGRAVEQAIASRGGSGSQRNRGRVDAAPLSPGVFWSGSTEAEIDERVTWYRRYVEPHIGPPVRARYEDEVRMPVQVGAFWLARRETTVGDFRRFVEETGYQANPRSVDMALAPSIPVTWVDLPDATAWCRWAGGRLPSGEEWEYAARGPEARRLPWGDEPPDGSRANFCDARCPNPWGTPDHDDGHEGLAPVGSYPAGATPEGLLDMAGNAREWTSSIVTGGRALVRGGGFRNAYDDMLPADVRANRGHERLPDLGFRCAWDDPPAGP